MVATDIMTYGRVTEWFKEPVLKTGVGQLTEGSNPSPSARLVIQPTVCGLFIML